ncbi:YolD-like family protein [Bacillus hominis]|uniref:YolD-like family protein n=1 Tax=Bacillus hominis TaxID=2817478 RepID=A0ABT7R7W8_9BACI|nr:YolD-like family protein [Bacillus hominis]MDM5433603.1 YolD-like family protein [Bacillus hominis]MDM5439026.1 YolD-like family protein [Bacillus hominis]
MIKWTLLDTLTDQFAGINEIIKDKMKVGRPILTQDEHNLNEKMLLSEEEILITYYEDGYLLTSYMIVTDIDPLNSAIICTDAFYNRITLNFIDIIAIK